MLLYMRRQMKDYKAGSAALSLLTLSPTPPLLYSFGTTGTHKARTAYEQLVALCQVL